MTTPSRSEQDEKIRAVLASRGDDELSPRRTSFYFYGGNLLGLDNTAAAAGYTVQPTVKHDGLVLQIMTAVDQQSFEVHDQRMEAWAKQFGCTYDGWECQVMAH
jgi:hypothetical protein